MAEYDKTDPTEPVDMDARMRGIRKRFVSCENAERDLRQMAQDDVKFAFVAGSQWDGHLGQYRGSRPKYEFNKLRPTIKQVINDNRKNTPAIKVRATEDGDKELADIRQGLIKNIESRSRADEVYDWGALYAITGGFGCWTIATQYADDGSFDQDIVIKRIQNPFSVWFDPAARELDRRDARFAFVENRMTKADFKAKYPKAEVKNFDSPGAVAGDHLDDWFGQDYVRIAEYWYKSAEKKTIHQLSDGRVVEAEEWDPVAEDAANPPISPQTGQPVTPPVTIVQSREVTVDKVKMEIISGAEVLEGPTDWAGKFIPIVPVWGDFINVDGRDEWYGMVRHSRDSQTLYNYNRSNTVEVIANQPRAPWLYTPKQIEGFETQWQGMARDNAIGLPYNPDADVPGGAPTRSAPPAFPSALVNAAQLDADDIKATTGVYDASLGAQGNETSGRAIQSRQRQTDTTTFDYSDNITRAIQYTGEIVNDLIPHIYDTERQIRILGDDGAEDFIRVNRPVFDMESQKWVKENDLSQGRYDITVTTGPNYATQRMETLDAMMQLVQAGGPLQPLAFYLAIKNMDVAGVDDILEGARKMALQAGLLEPGEDDQPPPPPQPNPKDVADAQAKEAQAAKYQADAQRAGAETAKTVVETQQMQLETQRMQEAHAVRQAIGQQIMAELPTQPGQTMFQQPLSIQP
jgi:hypothetical protein